MSNLVWHAACSMLAMESKIVALLSPEGSSREATLLMRRADGQFAMARIDARMASAARAAAVYEVAASSASAIKR